MPTIMSYLIHTQLETEGFSPQMQPTFSKRIYYKTLEIKINAKLATSGLELATSRILESSFH